MNRLQKMAWYNLILIIAVLTLTGTVVAVLAHKYGVLHARDGLCMLGLLGFLGLSSHLFRKKHGKTDLDERDQFIQKRATLIAYTVFWVVWILGSMTAWLIIGPGNSVPVVVLPLIVLVGGLIVTSVQSVAILIQYGWKEKNNE